MKNKEKRQKTIKNNDSRTFVVNYAFVAITRFLGGHFLLKFGGRGHKSILYDWDDHDHDN